MNNPSSIIEVHLLVRSSTWRKSLKFLHETVTTNGEKPGISTLYYTYDIEDLEVRICYLVNDYRKLENYIVQFIRPIVGISAARVRLTLHGQIFPDGLRSLLDSKKNSSVHIFIKSSPSLDSRVWRSLSSLRKQNAVFPTWIFRDFYEYDRDITLRVMGPSIARVKKYLLKNLSKIKGIESWSFKTMEKLIPVWSKKKLSELAKMFIS